MITNELLEVKNLTVKYFAEEGVVEALDDLQFPDRQALGVARALKEDRELLVADPGAGTTAQSPLLDDHAAFLVDLLVVEHLTVRPVLEDLERGGDEFGAVGRHHQHVDGLIEARIGVEVGPEAHADPFQVVDQLLLLEMLGPVERHVLHEVDMISDRVVLMSGGYVVAEGQIQDVRSEIRERPMQILIRCKQPHALASKAFEQDHVVEAQLLTDGSGVLVKTRDPERFYRRLNHLALRGIDIQGVAPADDNVACFD